MTKKPGFWVIAVAVLLFTASASSAAGKKDTAKEKTVEQNSCVATAKGPLAPAAQAPAAGASAGQPQVMPAMARVGQPAPDFEANAFVKGSFKNLKLSDSKGKWTVLCFYPGDFTFV